MTLCLFVLDEEASGLDNDIHTEFLPRKSRRTFANSKCFDLVTVHNDDIVTFSFYSAFEATLCGVVFKQISEIFRRNEVVYCNHLDFRAEKTLFNE